MITKTIKLYTFAELSDDAKEKAREWWREGEGQDFGSFGELNEPVETAAKLLGIELRTRDIKLMGGGTRQEPCVWWTLHVQGAGASFDATYSYAKGSTKAIRAEFGTDATLHAIADGLAAIRKRYGYMLQAVIKSDTRGHFLDVELELDRSGFQLGHHRSIADADDEAMRELFRDFARWIYKYIDAEYDSRMEDEYVDDAIKANEYTFTANGKRESL
jgi:hypothetical protein